MSKGGLEPPRPHERQSLKLVRLPISPLRRGVERLAKDDLGTNGLLIEQESQRDHREQPDGCQHSGDAIEVLFGSRRAKSGATCTSEHVRETPTLPTVKQNAHNQGQHGNHVDHESQVENERTHGCRAYPSEMAFPAPVRFSMG